MRNPKGRTQPYAVPASDADGIRELYGAPALSMQQIILSRATRYWAAYEALRALSWDQVSLEALKDFARQERGGEVL